MHFPPLLYRLIALLLLNHVNALPASISKPSSLSNGPSLLDGASSLNSTSLSSPKYFPLTYKIPDTDMTLHYAFPGFWWYTVAIDAVLFSTEGIIQHQLLVQGDGKLLMDREGGQSFRNSVHKGVDIRVNNLKPYAITWGDLEDLMKGLRDECFLQTCEFEFSIGSGMRIGGGALYKA